MLISSHQSPHHIHKTCSCNRSPVSWSLKSFMILLVPGFLRWSGSWLHIFPLHVFLSQAIICLRPPLHSDSLSAHIKAGGPEEGNGLMKDLIQRTEEEAFRTCLALGLDGAPHTQFWVQWTKTSQGIFQFFSCNYSSLTCHEYKPCLQLLPVSVVF